MAAAERREARRRKNLLQNSEERLQKILGTRSIHHTTSKSELEPSESVLNSASTRKDVSNEKKFDVDPKESESTVGEKDVLSVRKDVEDQTINRDTTKEPVCESQDVETDKRNYVDKEFQDLPEATSHQEDSPRTSVNKTTEDVSSSSESRIWTRVIFNVTLAILLVSKWTYVNLEVLLSTNSKQDPDSSERVLLQSESMIWPFLALQLLFVCVPSFRQTSHSAYISMLTVALQLCGIPIEFTHKVNFIFTALLAALKDFGLFLFSVIVVHCIVQYSITTGLLEHALKTFE
ncbi:hypothetical protein ACROYT_G019094 [Oculina patagonica]